MSSSGEDHNHPGRGPSRSEIKRRKKAAKDFMRANSLVPSERANSQSLPNSEQRPTGEGFAQRIPPSEMEAEDSEARERSLDLHALRAMGLAGAHRAFQKQKPRLERIDSVRSLSGSEGRQPQAQRPDPLAQAEVADEEAQRLETVALTLDPEKAKVALQLAKSYRAGAKLRRKQAAWEASQVEGEKLSNLPPRSPTQIRATLPQETTPESMKESKPPDGAIPRSSRGSRHPGIIPAPERFEAYARNFQKSGEAVKAAQAESMARQLRRFSPKAVSSNPAPKERPDSSLPPAIPEQEPQPRQDPLALATANELEAERLEKIAADPTTPTKQAEFALQQAKSARAAAKLRRKQAEWEASQRMLLSSSRAPETRENRSGSETTPPDHSLITNPVQLALFENEFAAQTTESARKNESISGFVYVLRPRTSLNGREVIKIGMTARSVSQRVRELQTGSMVAFDVVYSLQAENARMLEKHLHACFAERRVPGGGQEFFYVSAEEAVAEIKKIETAVSRERARAARDVELNTFLNDIGAKELRSKIDNPLTIIFIGVWISIFIFGPGIADQTFGRAYHALYVAFALFVAPLMLAVCSTRMDNYLTARYYTPRFGSRIAAKHDELRRKYPLAYS